MQALYRSITWAISPLLPLWLEKRRKAGKEDSARIGERFGHAGLARPQGKLLWVHAASVGESNAALPLIEKLLAQHSALNVLLTTGTVTSAALMKTRLPARAVHQFVPVDTPAAVRRFMTHWKPDVALFIDSELWPNLIHEAYKHGTKLGLVNARMSEKSYHSWRFARGFIRGVLSCFSLCFAQTKPDAERLRALGVRSIEHIGNLKYDVPALACNEQALADLREQTAMRRVWLGASTHPGEELQIATAHLALKSQFADLLTVIVPRHATRAESILTELNGFSIAQRSKEQPVTGLTDVYLADTMGELGLFYRLAEVAFIGGSLVPHGGQNPIEALNLRCPVILGPHMENFDTVARLMKDAGACVRVQDAAGLAGEAARLLADKPARQALAEAGFTHVKACGGSVDAIVHSLADSLRGV